MRRTSFPLLVALSLGVAIYALVAYGLFPLGAVIHPDMRATFESQRAAIYAHVFGSVVALALGPFQFSAKLRTHYVALHRWLGRFYLGIGVLIGGAAGLFMAFHAYGGAVARSGFACLALAWLYTGARAYAAVRTRDIVSHRRWMIRNFALTFAAVSLRLWLPASMLVGARFEIAYPIVAWLCWLPNLLLAEFLCSRTSGPAMRRSPPEATRR